MVSSYQAVSGTGAAAIEELRAQTGGNLAGDEPEPSVYPHPIAFNVLPHIGPFDENGYSDEELKVIAETKKMLGLPDLAVSATCVRVPVFHGHSEAIHIETTEPIDATHVRELLMAAPGISLRDEPGDGVYPLPREAEGLDEVLVGRIRKDLSHPNGVALWLSSDNLRKGAATNAVQIAESLVTNGWITPSTV